MQRSLSVQEWHELAEKGTDLPVRIMLNGASMHPLIRWNRDYVTVVPMKGSPVIGDIVLFSVHGSERYVAHRVWEISDKTVLTWGDNCDKPDGWIPLEAVLGKIVLIERGKRKIIPNPEKGYRLAQFWHSWGKGYRLFRRGKEAAVRRAKKMRMWVNK